MLDRLARLFRHHLYFEEHEKLSLVVREPPCLPAAIGLLGLGVPGAIVLVMHIGPRSLTDLLLVCAIGSILPLMGIACCVDSRHHIVQTEGCLVVRRRIWWFRWERKYPFETIDRITAVSGKGHRIRVTLSDGKRKDRTWAHFQDLTGIARTLDSAVWAHQQGRRKRYRSWFEDGKARRTWSVD